MRDITQHLALLQQTVDAYLEYLHGDGPLGADAFQQIKGRVITAACMVVDAMKDESDE